MAILNSETVFTPDSMLKPTPIELPTVNSAASSHNLKPAVLATNLPLQCHLDDIEQQHNSYVLGYN